MNAITPYSEPDPLPPPTDSNEGKLLLREARDYMAEPAPSEEGNSSQNGGERRAESKRRLKGCTGERLFKEEPRRYRLIASLIAEGTVSERAICRNCLCDKETVQSVAKRESEAPPATKRKLTQGYGRLARMTLDRLEQEVPNMNHSALAITGGIATDKFLNLVGEPSYRVAVDINGPRENIFDRMARLHGEMVKVAQARVIEPILPALTET